MDAADLLLNLAGAGFELDVADGKLLVTPASRLTDKLRLELRANKPGLIALLTDTAPADPQGVVVGHACSGCRNFGRRRTCLEPVTAGLLTETEGFGIAWPPEGYRANCAAFKVGSETTRAPVSPVMM
jgi:hypothetical protein